ncbi:MAG: VrrA/YqfQ family protein [bacterium]|nr:VrrA/YqfQ family protein [bacterium]
MNYYNPYFYTMPTSISAPRIGLFSRLFSGRGVSFSGILNGTQKALNFANQAIPLVKQVKPMIGNAKTMFKVMNEFKRTEKPLKNNNNINNNINTSTIQEKENLKENLENSPTFFM